MGGLDAFVLLTPVLVLGVLALLAFVGCNQILGLKNTCLLIDNFRAIPGDGEVFLSWRNWGGVAVTVVRGTIHGGPYAVISASIPSGETYRDTGLQSGVTFYYDVVQDLPPNDPCYGNDAGEVSATPVPPFVAADTLGTIRQDYTGFVGMAIVVGGNPLTVYALGRIVAPGNSDSHEVKIVDAATNADVPGSNVVVATAGGVVGNFVYTDLASPVTLNPNATYYILSRESLGVDQWYNDDTTVTTTNVASVTNSVNGDGVSTPPYQVRKPSDANGNYAFGPVNFKYFGTG